MKHTSFTRALALLFLAAAPVAHADPDSSAGSEASTEQAISQKLKTDIESQKLKIIELQKKVDSESNPFAKASIAGKMAGVKEELNKLEAALAEATRRVIREGDKIILRAAHNGLYMTDPVEHLGWPAGLTGAGKAVFALKGSAGPSEGKQSTTVTGSPETGQPVLTGQIVGIESKNTTRYGYTRMYESRGGWVYFDSPKARGTANEQWWKIKGAPPDLDAAKDIKAQMEKMKEAQKEGRPLKEGDRILFQNEYWPTNYLSAGKKRTSNSASTYWMEAGETATVWIVELLYDDRSTPIGSPRKMGDIVETKENATQTSKTYSVMIGAVGGNKIAVVRVVRAAADLSLNEAKELVDQAEKSPSLVKEALSEEAANKLKAELEAAGATVTIK